MLKCEKNKFLSKKRSQVYSITRDGENVGVVYNEDNHWYVDSWRNNLIHWQCNSVSDAKSILEKVYKNKKNN